MRPVRVPKATPVTMCHLPRSLRASAKCSSRSAPCPSLVLPKDPPRKTVPWRPEAHPITFGGLCEPGVEDHCVLFSRQGQAKIKNPLLIHDLFPLLHTEPFSSPAQSTDRAMVSHKEGEKAELERRDVGGRDSPINQESGTRDEGGVITRQERCCSGHL